MNELMALVFAAAIVVITGIASNSYVSGEQAKAITTIVSKGADPIAAKCAVESINNMTHDICLAVANKK